MFASSIKKLQLPFILFYTLPSFISSSLLSDTLCSITDLCQYK